MMANLYSRSRCCFGALAISCFSLSGCGHSSPDQDAAGPNDAAHRAIVVDVTPVARREIGKSITAIGRCEALPQNDALITPVIEGRVAEMLAKRGDQVAAGQAVIKLDTTLAEADLVEKQANRDSLVASLRVLQSVPRTEEQQSSKLAIDQAVVAVQRAQAQLDRLKPLRERNEVPDAQIVDAQSALKQAELLQQTAQAQYEQLMIAPRQELIAEAQSKIAMADDAVKTAQARLDLHTIRAPIAGVLDSLTCRAGQSIAVGTSVGEVINSQEVLAVAWLPASLHQTVQIGQAASIRSQSVAAMSTKDQQPSAIEGRVVYVGQSTDPQTGNLAVHVQAENSDGKLVVGQTLVIEIQVQKPTAGLCVPLAAVHEEESGPAVTVVRDGKAVVTHPKLGAKDASWVAVLNTDLKEGELVAVSGAYNLPENTPVETNVIRDAAETKPSKSAAQAKQE